MDLGGFIAHGFALLFTVCESIAHPNLVYKGPYWVHMSPYLPVGAPWVIPLNGNGMGPSGPFLGLLLVFKNSVFLLFS